MKLLTLALFASLCVVMGCGLALVSSSTIADLEREIEVTKAKLSICKSAAEYDKLTAELQSLINEMNKKKGAGTEPDT